MNPERLLQHFDTISEAPDAVARLWRLILDLAVRGKLVEQEAGDEPASSLFARLHQNPGSSEPIKGRRKVQANSTDQIVAPFYIPQSWLWVRLAEVGHTQTGGTPSKSVVGNYGGIIPFIKPGDISHEGVNYEKERLSEQGLRETGRVAVAGSLLMVCIGTIGKCQLIERRSSFNQQINAVSPSEAILPRYLLLACMSDFFQLSAAAASARTTIAILNKGNWEKLPLPIPPLAEQHRIVAKVDELMALCDQLQAARDAREQQRDRLVAASLHRMTSNDAGDSDDAMELENRCADSARFHLVHLPRLSTRHEHIKQLRQTILNLAVRGKLVAQDAGDGSAKELLLQNAETQQVGEFPVPAEWVWARVADFAESRLGKMLDKAKNRGTPKRYLRNVNVRWFNFNLSDVQEMRLEDTELQEFSLRAGDVLVCEGGEPGRAAVWDERESNIYFQKALHRVRFEGRINPHYFVNVLRDAASSRRISNYFTGVGIKHFTGKGLSSFLVPIPPLSEQHRIVAKIDELMALCDQLEASLATTQSGRTRLLDALLHEALAEVA